jgi:group I intron endonuclease
MKLLAYTNEKLEDLYKTGIYQITNLISGKIYVGSASRYLDPKPSGNGFYYRWGGHLRDLNKNEHANKHLQYSWNKYGEDAFDFKILEFVDPDLCEAVEQTYLDALEEGNHYNIYKQARGAKGHKKTKEERDLQAKEFSLISPEGIVFTGLNIKDFAESISVPRSNLTAVVAGKILHAAGWTASIKCHELWKEACKNRGITKGTNGTKWRVRYIEEGKNKVKYTQTKEEAIEFRDSLEEKGYKFKIHAHGWRKKLENAQEDK